MQAAAFFQHLPGWVVWGSIVLVFLVLGYFGFPLWVWAAAGLAALIGLGVPAWALAFYLFLVLVFNIGPVRRQLLTGPLMKLLDRLHILPVISETEDRQCTRLNSNHVAIAYAVFCLHKTN